MNPDSLGASSDSAARNRYLAWMVVAAVGTAVLISGFSLLHSATTPGYWPGYQNMMSDLSSPLTRLRWVLGDISEVLFYKHEFASLGLLFGGALGYWASRYTRICQGFSISYGSGLWPWLVTSSALGLLLSNTLWGWTLKVGSWQPTFVTFVSLPAAMVLQFGGGWKITLNGAILGALLVTPACLLIVNYVCVPLNLPSVIGNVLGMALGSLAAFALCHRWQVLVSGQPGAPVETARQAPPQHYGLIWTLRRVLADFSEALFFGNEWASLGLLGGVLLAYALNPLSPVYGSGLLFPLLGGQALTSLLGVILWRRQWQQQGWYPTYVPLVSVVPAAILMYGGNPVVMAASAGLGALIAPPLAHAIARRLPMYMHPYIGNVLSMAISTSLILPIVGGLPR